MGTDWISKLRSIKLSENSSEKSKRLSVGPKRALCVDGEEVPYEHLPLAFDCLSSKKIVHSRSGGSRRVTYTIDVAGDRFSYHKFDNNDFEYTFKNLLHCPSGPAKSRDGTLEFYKSGMLHNEDGAARIALDVEGFFLDGKELSIIELIERSPQATHSWGVRGCASFTTSKLGKLAVIRGMDGTVALLEASADPANIDDLLLDLVATRLPGYRVKSYINVGQSIAPVYSYLKLDKAPWKTGVYLEATKATYVAADGTRAILSFSKNSHNLTFKWKSPTGTIHSYVTDFSFDPFLDKPAHIAKSFPAIEIRRDASGRLHNIESAAVLLPEVGQFTSGDERHFINGFELSKDEHRKYDTHTQSIVFANSAGKYHRDDGPAIIDFLPQGEVTKYWFQNGQMVSEPALKEGEKLINLTGTQMPTYTDLNAKQDQQQNKFEEALKRVSKRANEAKEKITVRGDAMETKTTKHGEARATRTDSRMKQVTSGAKLGLQKAALRVGTQKVAEKIVEVASPADNIAVQRIVQLALLIGTAELAERLPDGAASKVGFTEERREGYGGLARYVAGETLGRDAVDIVSFVAPMLLDKLQGISAEEIAELTSDAEEVERLEAQVSLASK